MSGLHRETALIHSDDDEFESAVAAPIYATAMFSASDADDFADMATRPRHDRFYTRYRNPTLARCERVVASLEGAEAALVTASGMGAIATAVLALVSQGDRVISQKSLYGGTASLLLNVLPRFGVSTTLVDQTDVDAFAAAFTDDTKLVILESPSNPLLQITDIRAVAELARSRGALSLVDNTVATPLNQRPLADGADLVVHSATKALGGHSDLMAGVIAGSAELIERLWDLRVVVGAILGPYEGFLLLRGLRTLALRVERQNRTALALARWLDADSRVARVHYPGLPSHPQHDLACRQMSGFGGVLSLELSGRYERAETLIGGLSLATRAASLGGVRTLVVHPAAMWAGFLNSDQIADARIPDTLIRVAVGLEHEADLIADFENALGVSFAEPNTTPRVGSGRA